jgi:hypothetical protein
MIPKIDKITAAKERKKRMKQGAPSRWTRGWANGTPRRRDAASPLPPGRCAASAAGPPLRLCRWDATPPRHRAASAAGLPRRICRLDAALRLCLRRDAAPPQPPGRWPLPPPGHRFPCAASPAQVGVLPDLLTEGAQTIGERARWAAQRARRGRSGAWRG